VAKLRNNLAICSHLCTSVTKQYNLVPAKGRWCSAAGKVTTGLAESNGSLPPSGWLIVTCGLTGISSGPSAWQRVWKAFNLPLHAYFVLIDFCTVTTCACVGSDLTLTSCWLADVAFSRSWFSQGSPRCRRSTQRGRAVLTTTANKFQTFTSRRLPTLHLFLVDVGRHPYRHADRRGSSLRLTKSRIEISDSEVSSYSMSWTKKFEVFHMSR